MCIWEGRVATLNSVAKEGLKKKVILERKKRGSYVDIWGRATQKSGTTYTMAPWNKVTNVAVVECTRGEHERQYQSSDKGRVLESLNKVGKHRRLLSSGMA